MGFSFKKAFTPPRAVRNVIKKVATPPKFISNTINKTIDLHKDFAKLVIDKGGDLFGKKFLGVDPGGAELPYENIFRGQGYNNVPEAPTIVLPEKMGGGINPMMIGGTVLGAILLVVLLRRN